MINQYLLQKSMIPKQAYELKVLLQPIKLLHAFILKNK